MSESSNSPTLYTIEFRRITKFGALFNYLKYKFPKFLYIDGGSDDALMKFAFSSPLSADEYNKLLEDLNAWVEPEFWWATYRTESTPMSSPTTNSNTDVVMSTWIFSPKADAEDPDIKIDSVKTIVAYSTPHIETFSNVDASATDNTCVFKLVDITRGIVVASITFDATSILNEFVDVANNGAFGQYTKFKSIQFFDISGMTANHDCIWQITANVKNSDLNVTLNGLQRVFYKKMFI